MKSRLQYAFDERFKCDNLVPVLVTNPELRRTSSTLLEEGKNCLYARVARNDDAECYHGDVDCLLCPCVRSSLEVKHRRVNEAQRDTEISACVDETLDAPAEAADERHKLVEITRA